ncbi:hypothetical protein CC78DRAFT_582761 [Lojkania enalia]|uniref:GPI anchored protein n=1 Tax=Lojkania enalia TaxID=147567 RepID=A0A9P4K6P3_9PLEO|nr:hypothetical protein CC78DRAFT_582761 [Didymosphaeria enalia]
MHLPRLLALPPTILFLLCAAPAASEKQWPHNLPRHMKYFPEDEEHVKRSLRIQEKLQRERPIGVKKMSADEGEMFFLDNWIFASDLEKNAENTRRSAYEEENVYANGSLQAFSPLRPHSEKSLFNAIGRFALPRALFGRGFECPTGTEDCSDIGAPDSCCAIGSACINIRDTGFGSVGCCPQGQTCAGTISCDTDNGYTSCPDSPNGGCCLPGYSCLDVGCVVAGTSTITVQPSTSAQPSPSSTTVVVPTSNPPSSSSPSPTPTSTLTSSASETYTCDIGWHSCPASLGGGCCQNGLECASGALCIDTASSSAGSTDSTGSTMTPSAPVRPTSESLPPSNAPTTSGTSVSVCPTGFYVCSAYYPSGCCRVGRDCQTTGSCIPISTITIVDSNGVTVVAPTGASFATTAQPSGTCATGWFSCASSLGGLCCPNGFTCGEQCSTSVAGGTQVVDKMAPGTATIISSLSIWALMSGAAAIGIAMIIL